MPMPQILPLSQPHRIPLSTRGTLLNVPSACVVDILSRPPNSALLRCCVVEIRFMSSRQSLNTQKPQCRATKQPSRACEALISSRHSLRRQSRPLIFPSPGTAISICNHILSVYLVGALAWHICHGMIAASLAINLSISPRRAVQIDLHHVCCI